MVILTPGQSNREWLILARLLKEIPALKALSIENQQLLAAMVRKLCDESSSDMRDRLTKTEDGNE